MLFKTRVGLSIVKGSFEIVAHKSNATDDWWVYAHLRPKSEGQGRTFFKTFSFGGAWINLIAFKNSADVEAGIGKAMQIIADAMTSSAPVCDLSRLGSADAWDKKWKQVRWS